MASKRWDGSKLLNHVLEGRAVTAATIDELLSHRICEDQHLELKGRGFFSEPDHRDELRKYIAGFANADGGVIIFGIRDRPSMDGQDEGLGTGPWVDGCPSENNPAWVADTIKTVVMQLGTPPRCLPVRYKEHDLLVVAVARAPALIPITKGNRAHYFLRIGHQTPQVPEFLVTDLMLGRRAHPLLALSANFGTFDAGAQGSWNLRVALEVTNDGLSWARELLVCGIGYEAPEAHYQPPTPGVLRYLDTSAKLHRWPATRLAMHRKHFGNGLQPFMTQPQNLCFLVPVPSGRRDPFRWRGVLLAMARDSHPWLLQLECFLDPRGRILSPKCHALAPEQLGVVSIADEDED